MRVTLEDYIGPYAGRLDALQVINAKVMLDRVNALLEKVAQAGVILQYNPATGTLVSGRGNGGFRPPECPIGAPHSSHKEGAGIDLFDPDGDIDNCIMENKDWLAELNLAIEHPSATRRWCHVTIRLPRSGNRIFYP